MYSLPHELSPKESELMCPPKQLLKAEDLSQQLSYTVPLCPLLHHRLGCLNQVKAGEDAASAMSTYNPKRMPILDHSLM